VTVQIGDLSEVGGVRPEVGGVRPAQPDLLGSAV
jgi:hypothetical protein